MNLAKLTEAVTEAVSDVTPTEVIETLESGDMRKVKLIKLYMDF